MSVSPEESTAAVESILARTGLPVSEDEQERLVRFYPIVQDWMAQLRAAEARYADPALVYPAAPHD